ncbi:MAG: methylated-DNA-[protein]-cysteine S-methyltransferase [Candidatus Poriferisodalaceae bacterium]
MCLVAWDDSDDPELSLAGSEHEVINERVEPVAAAFERYFRGEREAVAELDVDLCLVGTEFRREVLGELHRLPVGTSTTYGQLGAAVGRPKGAQAVGGAVGANPIPIVIPCHRVLAADGSLGGFSGGLPAKRWLLANEGVAVPDGGWVPSHRLD